MLGEIPYMIVWGFFSAMGWMTASWTVDKYWPKEKEQTQIVQQEKKEEKKEEQKTSP